MDSDHLLLDKDFAFAFNNVDFSDRLLRIEISCSTIVDCVRDHKRRREDEDGNKKHQEQESESDGEDENHLRVEELHVSSAILAAKSPFFYKLFSNGMLESKQKHATLKINSSEETAVIELLKFMYSSNSLSSVTTVRGLLDVLVAADKFEVSSCMKHCISLLLKKPMTLDSALRFLELPSSVLMADSVKPLINVARSFIASRYKDIFKFPSEEVMDLPLVGIEAILASNELQIASEDIIYEVVLRWVKLHYSDLEERQEILGSHLARYIRFPYMSCRRLKKILTSDDFKSFSVASKLVLEALFFKTEGSVDKSVRFLERAYKYKPIKVLELEAPKQQCIVYLDLNRKECERLYPSNRLHSQAFGLGGKEFFLSVQCNMDQQDVYRCFGMFLAMHDKGGSSTSQILTVDYEFSARSKTTEEFAVRYKGTYTFSGGKAIGYRNLFGMPWDYFVDKDCLYFINDVVHLRAELSIHT